MTPTARTLKALRDDGWTAGVVERFNSHTLTRHDLFGCIDIVAVRDGNTLGVQATSGSNAAARVKKMRDTEAVAWLRAGNALEVWGWRKVKLKRGGKAVRWQASVRPVLLSELAPSAGGGA